MGRRKSFPEQHLASPATALARFQEIHPGCEDIVALAAAQVSLAKYARYGVELADWKKRFDRFAERVSPPPELPNCMRVLVGADARMQFFVKRHEELARLYARVEELRELRLPEVPSPRETTDEKLLLGVGAVWAAERRGVRLGPVDLVLLEVAVAASGMAGPTSDPKQYADRIDRWRKKMPAIRALTRRFRQAFDSEKGNR